MDLPTLNTIDRIPSQETLLYSPSSTGIQPWKFLVVGKETRAKLLPSSGHNQQIFSDSYQYSAFQVYIALGNLLTSAALLGLDSTPIGGFNAAGYDAILGLNGTPYRSVVLATVGYHAEEDANAKAAKVRFPKDQVIQHV